MCLKIAVQRMYIGESRYTRQKALKRRGLRLYWIRKNNKLIWRNEKWQQ